MKPTGTIVVWVVLVTLIAFTSPIQWSPATFPDWFRTLWAIEVTTFYVLIEMVLVLKLLFRNPPTKRKRFNIHACSPWSGDCRMDGIRLNIKLGSRFIFIALTPEGRVQKRVGDRYTDDFVWFRVDRIDF